MALPVQGLAECSICYEAYRGASSGRAPKLLWCRHAVCLACLRKLACRNTAFPFVVCPFCRTVTAVPEGGLRTLRNDESLLLEMAPAQGRAGAEAEEETEEDKDAPRPSDRPRGDAARSLELSYSPGSPIFAVSSFVLVELPGRAASRDSETPAALENLRLCFAVTILLLIVSVFFALVFLK